MPHPDRLAPRGGHGSFHRGRILLDRPLAQTSKGADVALSYLPEEQVDAEAIASLVEEAGRRAVCSPGDLNDPQYCISLVKQAAEELGGLDILVNNAGKQVAVGSLEQLSDEQLDHTYRTNLYSFFRVTREAPKHLAQQLAPKGIRVNAVAPGPIWTPLQVSDGQPREALPEFDKSTPLGRAGQPTELAPAYVFLASAE